MRFYKKQLFLTMILGGLLSPLLLCGQGDDYYQRDHLRYQDHVYADHIKTVQLYKDGFELSSPIIELHAGEQLHLAFDDLDRNLRNYRYRLVHCSFGWTPTDMVTEAYIDGFEEGYIERYSRSFNTIQAYTHYDLVFPEGNMELLLSGNYLLLVYIEDPEKPVFTKRFFVFEKGVTINASVKRATSVDDMDEQQEIDFTVDFNDAELADPYSNVKVMLQQNGRWDNRIQNLKPKMIIDGQLIYDFEKENLFMGGNEFRRFDMKSLRYQAQGLQKIETDEKGLTHVWLFADHRRPFLTYAFVHDINGRYLVKSEDNARDSHLESEYAYVHFQLPYQAPLVDGAIYIMGGLTNWEFNEPNKMQYNYIKQSYESALFLKQGYYNYQYIFLKNGQDAGEVSLIEGSHYETANEYTIYVYYSTPGTNYDRLIGVKRLGSQ